MLQLLLIPVLILPNWFHYMRRKQLIQCLDHVETALKDINIPEERRKGINIFQNGKAVYFVIAISTINYIILIGLLMMMTYSDREVKSDYRLIVTTLSTYWYEYLWMLDFVPTLLLMTKLFDTLNRKLKKFFKAL